MARAGSLTILVLPVRYVTADAVVCRTTDGAGRTGDTANLREFSGGPRSSTSGADPAGRRGRLRPGVDPAGDDGGPGGRADVQPEAPGRDRLDHEPADLVDRDLL